MERIIIGLTACFAQRGQILIAVDDQWTDMVNVPAEVTLNSSFYENDFEKPKNRNQRIIIPTSV